MLCASTFLLSNECSLVLKHYKPLQFFCKNSQKNIMPLSHKQKELHGNGDLLLSKSGCDCLLEVHNRGLVSGNWLQFQRCPEMQGGKIHNSREPEMRSFSNT